MACTRRFAAKAAFVAVALGAVQVSAAEVASSSSLSLSQFDTIFGFGDSYSAFGYGHNRKLIPAKQKGLGYSGGPIWLQYLSNATSAPANQTWDFAIGGATTDDSIVASAPYVPDLVAQVTTFLDVFGNDTAPGEDWTSDGALFAIAFGTNDVGLPMERGYNVTAVIPAIFASLDAQIARLVAAGARHFLLPNVSPLHRTPRVRRFLSVFQSVYEAQVLSWNAEFAAHVAALPATFPSASFTHVDFFGLALPIYDAYEAQGFKSDSYCEGYTRTEDHPAAWDEDACVWPLAEFLFRDDYHLSSRTHQLLATAAVDALATSSPSRRLRRSFPQHQGNPEARWNSRYHKHAPEAVEPW